MLTGTMTIDEVHREISKDMDFLNKTFINFVNRNKAALNKRKKELKREDPNSCKRFITFYKTKSPLTRITYCVAISYLKDSDMDFLIEIFAIFEHSNGKRSLVTVCDDKMEDGGKLMYSFDFHVISRFAERSGVVEDSEDFNKMLKLFFSDLLDDHLYLSVGICKRFNKNREYSLTMRTKSGTLIGDEFSNFHIFKTFISNEMLYENQEDLLEFCDQDFEERFGDIMYDTKTFSSQIENRLIGV